MIVNQMNWTCDFQKETIKHWAILANDHQKKCGLKNLHAS